MIPCFSRLEILSVDRVRLASSYDRTLRLGSRPSAIELLPKFSEPIRSSLGEVIRDNMDVEAVGIGDDVWCERSELTDDASNGT